MKSAVAKGKLLEDWVAQTIRESGLDPKAYRSHGSGNGNTEKGDIWTSLQILGQNVGIECKNQKNIAIPDWWKQVRKLESLGREPLLVFKLPHSATEDALVTMYWQTLIDLLKTRGGAVLPQIAHNSNRNLIYKIETARRAMRELEKELENYA